MLKIRLARPTGGKAGRGHNKTSTVQVVEVGATAYRVLKQFRYIKGSGISLISAWCKASHHLDVVRRDRRKGLK